MRVREITVSARVALAVSAARRLRTNRANRSASASRIPSAPGAASAVALLISRLRGRTPFSLWSPVRK